MSTEVGRWALPAILPCCVCYLSVGHPEVPKTQQIALAPRIVSDLSVKQIARSFRVSESAMEQRITRAKSRIAAADVPFEPRRARSSALSGSQSSPPWSTSRSTRGTGRVVTEARCAGMSSPPKDRRIQASITTQSGDR